MFVSGVSLLIGLNNAGKFFFGANLKSSALFFGGIFIVLIGYSIIGMLIESVGLFYLFRCVRACVRMVPLCLCASVQRVCGGGGGGSGGWWCGPAACLR